jgi:hypothetical protein
MSPSATAIGFFCRTGVGNAITVPPSEAPVAAFELRRLGINEVSHKLEQSEPSAEAQDVALADTAVLNAALGKANKRRNSVEIALESVLVDLEGMAMLNWPITCTCRG